MKRSNLATVYVALLFGTTLVDVATSCGGALCGVGITDEFECLTLNKNCCWHEEKCYSNAANANQATQQYTPQQPQPPRPQHPQQPQPGRPYFQDTTPPPYATPYPGAPNPYQQQPSYQTQPPPYGQCNELPVPDRNTIKMCSNKNYYGSVCTFRCNAGWRMYLGSGDKEVKCQTNGQWSGKAPSCTTPPMMTGGQGMLPFPPQAGPNGFPQQQFPPRNQQNNYGSQQPTYGAQQPNYGQQQQRPSNNVNNLFETLGLPNNQQQNYNNNNYNNNNNRGTPGGALGTNVAAPAPAPVSSGSGSGRPGDRVIPGIGTLCSLAVSIKDKTAQKQWMDKYQCTGNEKKIEEGKADAYVKNLLGGLVDPSKPQNQPRAPGSVGGTLPQYGSSNQQIIPKHAPSSLYGQQSNQAMCKLLKSAKLGSSKSTALLAAQYGCPLTSSSNSNPLLAILSGQTPSLPSLLNLFGGAVKKDPEYKKGAILLDAIPYGTLKKCWEKADEYPTCKYASNINVRRETECYNIGCVYKPETGQCFSCSLVPASAYLLQQTTDTCDVITTDRDECPDFKKFQLSTIMFAAQNPSASSSSSSSSTDISKLLGGSGLGGLSGLFGGSGGTSSSAASNPLAQLLAGGSSGGGADLAALLGSGGGTNPLLGMFQRSNAGSSPLPTNEPPPPPIAPDYSDSVISRRAGAEPVKRNLDLMSLMAGGGGMGGLAGLLGAGGGGGGGTAQLAASLLGGGGLGGAGGAAGLMGLLGGGAGAAGGGAFGGMNPKLLQAMLSNNKPSSSGDLIALLYGGSGINAETKKVLEDGCKKKQCCWKPGGSLGGTCYSKGNNFKKNCIPTFTSGDCGRSPSNTFARIIGGFDITSNTHRPWTAVIKAAGQSTVRCGGTLICSQWILTSASCLAMIKSIESDSIYVPSLEPDSLNIWVGTTDPVNPENDGTRVAVADIIPHPQYVGGLANDIALIQISQLLFTDEKKPACLPELSDRGPSVGNILRFAGFGEDSNGFGQSDLSELDMTVKSFTSCDSEYGHRLPAAGVFCAYSSTGKDTCTGDGGSGAMSYDADNDVFKLVGINIAGSDGCDGSKASIFTKLSTFMAWIAQTTNGCCETFGSRVA